MLQVAQVTTVHRPDDTRVRHRECGALTDAGVSVTLVAKAGSELTEPDDAVRRVPLPEPRTRWARLLQQPRLLRELLTLDADVYQFHDPELFATAVALHALGRVVVVDIHEDYRAQIKVKPYLGRAAPLVAAGVALAEAASVRFVDGTVVARPAVHARLARHARRLVLVENFAEPSDGVGPFDLTSYRCRPPVACYVGSVSRFRGLKDMVEAAQLASDWELALAGPVSRDEASERLMAGIPDPSVYRGVVPRSELPTFLSRCRVGLSVLWPVPSHLADRPTKVFEYMAAGLPVVTSDLPGSRHLVEEAGCGIVIPSGAPEALDEAVSHLMTHPEEAWRMGQAGREAVLSRFSWAGEAARYVEFIRGLAERPSAGSDRARTPPPTPRRARRTPGPPARAGRRRRRTPAPRPPVR